MKIQLSEDTLRAILDLSNFKEQTMTALETLNKEAAETKAAITAVGVAVADLKAKYDAAVAALLAAVTPAQIDAAKATFDEAQAAAQAIVDSLA